MKTNTEVFRQINQLSISLSFSVSKLVNFKYGQAKINENIKT